MKRESECRMGVSVRATASQVRWGQEDSYQLADAICGLVNAVCRSFSKSVSVHAHHTGTERLIHATHGRGTEQVFQAHTLLRQTVKCGQEWEHALQDQLAYFREGSLEELM